MHTTTFGFRNTVQLKGAYSNKPKAGEPLLVLAHGANGGMEHPLLTGLASALDAAGHTVLRFEFPYAAEGKKSPNADPVLEEAWFAVLEQVRQAVKPSRLIIGGKSLGGRSGSSILADDGSLADGILFLGFPLHAPGRYSADRAAHLSRIDKPVLFIQGTRDPLASRDLISTVAEKHPRAELHIINGADHSFRVPGRNESDVRAEIAKATADWLSSIV